MNGSALNSSSSASAYFWAECDPHDDDDDGKLGGLSAGLLILFTTYFLEFLVGAPLNLWLISHILRKMSKVTSVLPADFFPLHLAFTQVSFYLVLPLLLANHFLWKSSSVMAAVTVLTSAMLIKKPLLLCLVCVERYMAVVRPLDYRRFKARQYRWGCLGVSWSIYILMVSRVLVEPSSATVSVVFLPVLAIDTFCSLSVLKTLKKPPPGDKQMEQEKKKEKKKKKGDVEEVEKRNDHTTQNSRKEERVMNGKRSRTRGKGEMNSMKRKAFITIAIIQAVVTLNYLPFIITWLLDGLVPTRVLKCQYVPMALAAAASCSHLQPLLYLHRLGRLPCMTSQKHLDQHLDH